MNDGLAHVEKRWKNGGKCGKTKAYLKGKKSGRLCLKAGTGNLPGKEKE